ncbi:MAG: hypothetical protein Q9160_005988 [Pyrenula sp. 1 TL-2023]
MAQTMDFNNLATEMEALAANGVKNDSSRERLLKAAQHVVAELEDPRQAIERTVYATSSTESTGPAILALPNYLERNKYRLPEDVENTAFTQAHKEAPTLYSWFATRPKHLDMFHRWMVERPYRAGHWLDAFPFEKLVAKPTDTPETVIFIDVGGGRGHQCLEIRNRFPNVKGRLILEDTESVIAGAVQVPNMDVVEVDFFKEQPIKGARTYYLRSILHNWPTKHCRTILRNIKSAMAPDSFILIDDMVMPEVGADKVAVSMDIAMMMGFTSEERTEKRWAELFDSVGLKIDGIYKYDERAHSSILAVKLKE